MTAATLSAPLATRPQPEQQLITAQDLFIRRWGEMGQTWGINRTMAEIHAFLYVSAAALHRRRDGAAQHQPRQCIDELARLCDWGIVRRLHKRGERREYFESLGDVWEMFSLIAAERKRREMDPVLETIRQCRQMLEESSIGKAGAKREDVQATRQRLAGMEEFMEVTNKIFQQFIGNARSGLTKVVRVLLKAF